jgi:hypothetical protein
MGLIKRLSLPGKVSTIGRQIDKPSDRTFEHYCSRRWGWKRAHAYRLIEASNTAAALQDKGPFT